MTIRKSGNSGSLVEAVTDGTGTIKLGPLVNFIAERQDALLTFEATPAIAACRAELEATNVIAEIDATVASGNGDGTTTNGNGVVDVADVDELVDRAVNRQMRSATAPEDRPVFEPIPTGERSDKTQAALLETFQLRPVPLTSLPTTNSTRCRSRSSTSGRGSSTARSSRSARSCTRSMSGSRSSSATTPDMPISTLADLERLMAEIKELSTSAQDELPAGLGRAGQDGDAEVSTTTSKTRSGAVPRSRRWPQPPGRMGRSRRSAGLDRTRCCDGTTSTVAYSRVRTGSRPRSITASPRLGSWSSNC